MKNTINVSRRWRQEKKVYGVPKLPHKIDAMYDNICRGSLMAYYLDPNPARFDPVYEKLEELQVTPTRESPIEKVAAYYQNRIYAREMDESTYNHLAKAQKQDLMWEFNLKYRVNKDLREKIEEEIEYMFRSEKKEWTDYP